MLANTINFLNCPQCKSGELAQKDDKEMQCSSCGANFPILSENSAYLIDKSNELSSKKNEIQQFWGDLYLQWYSDLDKELTPEKLLEHIKEMEELFYKRNLLPVVEMNLKDLKGKNVLEIGCGGGGHSIFFKKNGANMTSVDITPERVVSTAKKFSMLDTENDGNAFVADAENLPFKDNSFDIVYSNGVLHHSESTEKCMKEVKRVLKDDGKAVIMLYSRHSAQFWLNSFIRAIVTGEFFKYSEKEWLGRLSEGKPKHRDTKNPLTRVYSAKEIKELFKDFNVESMRKNGFIFSQLPLMRRPRNFILKALGHKPSPGGTILYGSPFIPESNLERSLAPYLGWSWNVILTKKNAN